MASFRCADARMEDKESIKPVARWCASLRTTDLPSYDVESPCQNASSLLDWSSAASDSLSIGLAVHVAIAVHD
jgi:hypothetical protein